LGRHNKPRKGIDVNTHFEEDPDTGKNYIRWWVYLQNKYQRADHLDLRETYQANSRTDGCRKCIDDIDSRIQPRRQFVNVTPGLARPEYLGAKYGEDSIWRVAGLKGAK
jgi:hypothetical protein